MWERKEELKAHKIELFSDQTDLEGLLKRFRSVERYGCLAGLSEERLITNGWKFFSPEVLGWFGVMLRNEYGIARFPPQRYPFGWRELKTRMEATYASAFSVNYAWRDLGNPKRGRGVSAFHSASRPCPLGRQGPRHGPLRLPPVDVYYEKMTLAEKHTLSSVIQMTRKLGKMLCLRDALAVIDEENLNSGGSATAKAEAPVPTVVSTTLTATRPRPNGISYSQR